MQILFNRLIHRLTTRELVPLPHVPLQIEKLDHADQFPSTGHGCVALQARILIGEPAQ